ncbi:chemotaxis protein CheX [Sporomusa malonica]|uniref:Chemotaxis protein CheX n=1 Tax=Sporomusa malonica TaxID=112901 RepID=A0A1W2DQ99_9FIRM|nr:chemotaxis protein CheX [Sporomusa malonica]SMC99660.1 chemotaxis protein CheX [Sporomusa malonica]
MDLNAINPILTAFASVLPKIGFQTVGKKSVSLEGSLLLNNGLMINIGVMGPLTGGIVIGMDVDSAKRFASTMMMGMDVAELDALAQSAISEMGNMVCANACTNFAQAGVDGLDISPPTLLLGKDGQVRLSVPQTIAVKFSVDDIDVDVYVGLGRH